jgi:hypothetical protein
MSEELSISKEEATLKRTTKAMPIEQIVSSLKDL